MRKLRFFVNFDKEEAWLNRMAAAGSLLTKARAVYTFVPVTPKSVVVRIDYRPAMSRLDFDDYLKLFEDFGWRHVCGSRSGGPQYFASFSQDANADIFSDQSSKAQRYRRSIAYHAAVLVPFLAVVIALWQQGTIGLGVLGTPRDWYLTPGLWDKQGLEFLASFLFETPFVLLRTAGPFLLPAFCVIITAQIAYQYLLYRRTVTQSAT